jgi:2'-5' RNA ligase
VRCFLAIPLAAPALGAAQRLQAGLRERVGGVRWARPETLHLTVHFFGEIDPSRAAIAASSVVPVAARTAPFDLELGRLGAFPEGGTPRVLWLGLTHEAPELSAFASGCHEALRGEGFDVESRPYRPHCTLGRPQRGWGPVDRQAWTLARADEPAAMHFRATRMVLFDSRSAPGGAVYAEQATAPFAVS